MKASPRIFLYHGSFQHLLVKRLRFTWDDGENHTVRVLSWLEGMPLRLAQPPPDIAFNLGENLAQLGIALKGFQHPASNYSLLWDVKRADNLRPLVAHITDKNIRQLCVQQLENFTQTVKPALSDVRWQVIFNDLHSSNVLVDEREGRVFAGIIDFGDMLRSPLVADVAVAIAYLCGEGGNALQNISKFLRGYASVTPLDEPEIALLYPLMLMRNCMTVLISSWRASIYPENVEYILESNKRAHRTIDVLSGMGYEKVTDEFHSACADSGGLV